MPLSTRNAPSYISHRMARLIRIYVRGFISAEIRPTSFCTDVRRSLLSRKRRLSSSSRPKARMTRAPLRFSRVSPSTRSRRLCTFWYSGIHSSIIPNTTTDRTGIANTKFIAERTSMIKAMIIAPTTTNGERSRSRRVMFTPDCT